MWLYICTCLVLFNVVKSTQVNNQPVNDRTDGSKQTEAIFVDVIKNISRVNNVLQELITNYEQLQKIYHSQENLASAYSDSEIDEVFKSKKAKRSKNEEIATNPPNSNKYVATQMFWSDHEEGDDNIDEDEKDGTKNEKEKDSSIEKEEEKESVIKKIKPKSLPITVKTTTLKSIGSSESKDSDSSDSISKEKVKEPKKIAKSKKKSKSALNVVKSKHPNAEVIFIDTHKKSKQSTDKTTKPKDKEARPKIEPNIQSAEEPFIKKTRYNKVSHKKPISLELQNLHNIMPNVELNNTRKVKQIMYSESFAPKKIWLDIINNKPIQLEAHSEVTLQAVNNTNMRSQKKGKNALVIESKKNKNKDEDSISSDDEYANEEMETNVLREAYGDACLKMVVRKCFSACKKAVKNVCKAYKCKGKSTFKSSAKSKCTKEFRGKSRNETSKLRKGDLKSEKAMDDNNDDYTFANLTRAGFLSVACLPTVESKTVSLRKSSPTSLKTQPENFNVLRDRYERACKKVSAKKCSNACTGAFQKMCDDYKCSKRMKKVFKKTCKKQCKNAYQYYGSGSDSDSDSYRSTSSDTD